MTLRLIQFTENGKRHVAAVGDDGTAERIEGASSTYELAQAAIAKGTSLDALVKSRPKGAKVDIAAALKEGRVLAPIDHPNVANLHLTGTGLTHLGSAEGRDKMHKAAASTEKPTNSMRMFLMGVEGGKPKPGEEGAQPEWFYKGNGAFVTAPEAPLVSPPFAKDGGEEPEIAAIYVIGPDGTPYRLGFALGNEFRPHHRARQLSVAGTHIPELQARFHRTRTVLPARCRSCRRHVQDRARRQGDLAKALPVRRGRPCPTPSPISNTTISNQAFRHPGDVHVHFFGTATLSFSDGIATKEGDVFEIEAKPFAYALRNTLANAPAQSVTVKAL